MCKNKGVGSLLPVDTVSLLKNPNFTSAIIKLSSNGIKSNSAAEGSAAINVVPLHCPWSPASSAQSRPSGRSDQSRCPDEDEENKNKKTSLRLNWIHLENHRCSLKCKTRD